MKDEKAIKFDVIKDLFKGSNAGFIGRHSECSVLVPFVELSEGLSLIYEVRSDKVSQPREVCFPGGHVEEGETPEDAALRETMEELGIGNDSIDIISEAGTIQGNSNFLLHSFIGSIERDSFLKVNPDEKEVAEVFTVPISLLMKSDPKVYSESMSVSIEDGFPFEKLGVGPDYPWHVPHSEIPVYEVSGHIIWGLTARITMHVVSIIKEAW